MINRKEILILLFLFLFSLIIRLIFIQFAHVDMAGGDPIDYDTQAQKMEKEGDVVICLGSKGI